MQPSKEHWTKEWNSLGIYEPSFESAKQQNDTILQLCKKSNN